MYEEVLKTDSITRKDVKRLKAFTPLFLDHFARTVNRTTGMGCNFIKFHLPLHISDDILRNGVCQNTSSGPGESGHKTKCKQPSKLTQRVYEKFEMQTAMRGTDHILIDRALEDIVSRDDKLNSVWNDQTRDLDDVNVTYSGRNYVCDASGIYTIYHNKVQRDSVVWADPELQASIHSLICNKVLPNVDSDEVFLITQCKRNGVLFRAHPFYKGVTSWQDWAYIDWGDAGNIPAHLLIFVDLTKLKHPITIKEIVIDVPGIYAIAHSMLECLENTRSYKEAGDPDDYKCNPSSHLILFAHKELVQGHVQPPGTPNNSKKRSTTQSSTKTPAAPEAQLYIIPCDSIESECIAVPDYGSRKHHGYFIVRSRKDWCDIFFSLMEK